MSSVTDTQLPKSYSPADHEPGVLAQWTEQRIGHGPLGDGPAFSVVIPPPNVTSALHLGHALNNTLQDILVRWHRMQGHLTMWMPGTDHAGIATQTVVEKRLLQQGITRLDIGREAFLERASAWKDEYAGVILGQLKAMGCSCDWDRTRFTMDPVCTAAVRTAFFRLFNNDLIYRGKRLVNWDPATRTALADDEVEMRDVPGHMWYLQYPLDDGSGHVTVATTRPETMLGDTAVAMNPNDPRATSLRGKHVVLPIVGRRIPIVEDDYVVMPGQGDDPKAAFATGFLKVTPAHDPNDWDIGLRHDLPIINVMGPDGAISTDHGWQDCSEDGAAFVGLSREDARDAIVQWFESAGLLEAVREYDHSVGHSYRSHVPIEPWLSDQWYVRVTDDQLAGAALRSMDPEQFEGDAPAGDAPGDGQLRFTPARYAKTFQVWHEQLRDWCISRQLWWGHQIPVWSKELPWPDAASLDDGLIEPPADLDLSAIADLGEAVCVRVQRADADTIRVLACVDNDQADAEASLERAGFVRDADVLDTWFSSALWPLSTMGWPDPSIEGTLEGLLDTFNPTSVLCTAREIITLWVSRMVMFNRYFLDGRVPFTDVTIHPMVQDGHGQKMSKSLGNGVDPRDIIETHGTDALRLVMAQIATATQDVRLPVDLIDPHSGKTFAPATVVTPQGHTVAAPIQHSPVDADKTMATVYGVLTGQAEVSEAQPLAKNTSSRFDAGRNFATKLWNAVRFALTRVEQPCGPDAVSELSAIDRWMCSRIASTTSALNTALAGFQFNVCADLLYDLIWRDMCDWYLEAIKPTVNESPHQQQVLLTTLDAVLRLLHPVCPFVTETAWAAVQATAPAGVPGLDMPSAPLLAVAPWPTPDASLIDDELEAAVAVQRQLVNAIRRVRTERQLPGSLRPTLLVESSVHDAIGDSAEVICTMARLDRIEVLSGAMPAQSAPVTIDAGVACLTDLGDAANVAGEVAAERLKALRSKIAALEGRLSNPGYVDKAPAHLVDETRAQLANAQAELKELDGASN
ncbi:MAG: valine--tRNA ligase [Phycisphaerales bacterium]|nr:valine--tRNA ligase [Phycisphaerales bacterium]